MKLLFLIGLLLSSISWAGVPQAASMIQMCGLGSDNTAALTYPEGAQITGTAGPSGTAAPTYKTLMGVSTSASKYWPLWDQTALSATAYKVPTSAKKFWGVCVCLISNSSIASGYGFSWGEGTTAVSATGTNTAPTGDLYSLGTTATATNVGIVISTSTPGVPNCYHFPYAFDSGDFPFIYNLDVQNVANTYYFVGKEY